MICVWFFWIFRLPLNPGLCAGGADIKLEGLAIGSINITERTNGLQIGFLNYAGITVPDSKFCRASSPIIRFRPRSPKTLAATQVVWKKFIHFHGNGNSDLSD